MQMVFQARGIGLAGRAIWPAECRVPTSGLPASEPAVLGAGAAGQGQAGPPVRAPWAGFGRAVGFACANSLFPAGNGDRAFAIFVNWFYVLETMLLKATTGPCPQPVRPLKYKGSRK
ncbi:MAG: hypothetical protein AMJ54_10510 [Deltaproteobacteria bacterium SG8_13]|nr:MAG: hypothetical protein AMJ54_10510 [Deltaproteobacteria bacterium SG8_13]